MSIETDAQLSERLPTTRLSLSAFARLIGVSQPAVSQAVEAGRITGVERAGNGRVWILDPAAAAAEWEANASRPTKAIVPEVAPVPQSGETLADVQRRVGVERARQLRFKNDLQAGQYVRKADVDRANFEAARVIREGFLNLTARVAPELLAETDLDRFSARLDDEVRAILTSLADTLERAS